VDITYAARKHAKRIAKDLSRCGRRYIVHIALKELCGNSGHDGFHLAESTILILCENRHYKLQNHVYVSAGALVNPPMNNDQVYQAINRIVKYAWKNRNNKIWKCYFPEGTPGYAECPTNQQFLFAVVDFIDLWEGCCEEVNYAKK